MSTIELNNLGKIGRYFAVALVALSLAACGGEETQRASDNSPAPSNPAGTPGPSAPPANNAPTISGSPQASVQAGNAYSFQPSASDADGDSLSYSITGKPSWATFSISTGTLSGTPDDDDVGTTSGISISVSDGEASASLAAFSIRVNAAPSQPPPPPANSAPTISGSPLTAINMGVAYSFRPSSSDDDGDSLTFSIENQPSWANFSTSSGRLSGTPDAGDVRSYNNIVITVSDGTASASLPAFSIAVNQVSNGSATVSWTSPTQNTDGSALTNLAGYRILYGTSSNNLNQSVQVSNAGLGSYVVEDLTQGTWYFIVKAYTSTGIESDASNVASKTIS